MRLACFLLAAAAAGAQVKAPRPAPEFQIAEPSGRTAKRSSYRGDVVLLAFIVTSCSHCQAASGEFEKLQSDFGRRGFHAALGPSMKAPMWPVTHGASDSHFRSAVRARTKCARFSAYCEHSESRLPRWSSSTGSE